MWSRPDSVHLDSFKHDHWFLFNHKHWPSGKSVHDLKRFWKNEIDCWLPKYIRFWVRFWAWGPSPWGLHVPSFPTHQPCNLTLKHLLSGKVLPPNLRKKVNAAKKRTFKPWYQINEWQCCTSGCLCRPPPEESYDAFTFNKYFKHLSPLGCYSLSKSGNNSLAWILDLGPESVWVEGEVISFLMQQSSPSGS